MLKDQNLAADFANSTKAHLERLLREHDLRLYNRDLDSLTDVIYWCLMSNAVKSD